MSRISLISFLAALAILPASAAHADRTPGWYAAGGVGANFTPDSKARLSTGDNTILFTPGYDVLGSVGYAYMSGWRTEVELGHSYAGVDKIHGTAGTNGNLDNTNLFLNGFYDFQNHSIFTPYVGLGLGGSYIDADKIGVLSNGGNLNDTGFEWAAQGIAGVSAQLDDNWALTADYRYVVSEDPKFKTTAGGKTRFDNASHNIIVGVRYSFDTPVAEPMMATTPTRASSIPAAPIVSKPFVVYFGFNKSTLTAESKHTLTEAAAAYKKTGYAHVMLTGHTDTVGGDAYNQKLSERRTATVTAELERLGVPMAAFDATSVGKKDLRVPTADNVKEERNRAVDVVLSK